MKKIMYFAAALLCTGMVSCNNGKTTNAENVDSTNMAIETIDSSGTNFKSLLTDNEGKTAEDAKLFENKAFTSRVKELTGSEYDSIVANFNTQTPITSENGVFKLTGGRAHEVPAFNTVIVYDSNNDNLNVIINKLDKKNVLKEKEEIKMTETLEKK